MRKLILLLSVIASFQTLGQQDARLYEIINSVQADRIESDIRTLANFGTRHNKMATRKVEICVRNRWNKDMNTSRKNDVPCVTKEHTFGCEKLRMLNIDRGYERGRRYGVHRLFQMVTYRHNI